MEEPALDVGGHVEDFTATSESSDSGGRDVYVWRNR